jgi:hypothetical protein
LVDAPHVKFVSDRPDFLGPEWNARCVPHGANSAFGITFEKLNHRSSLNFARSELGPILYMIRRSSLRFQ